MYSAQLFVGFLISNFWSVKMCYTWSVKCITKTIKIVQTPSGILYNSPVLKETKFISFIHDLVSFCFSYALDVTFLVISRLVCKISHNLVKFSILDEHPNSKCVFLPWKRNPVKFHAFNKMCTIHPFFDAIPVHYICHMEPKFLEKILFAKYLISANTALRNIPNNRTFIRTSLMLPCVFIQ